LWLSARGTWGSSPTRSCGSTSSRRSTSPRMRGRGECDRRCTLEAAPSRCRRVEVSCTSWRSSSHRISGGTMAGSTYATMIVYYLVSLARS
jgi:hypothetical protein